MSMNKYPGGLGEALIESFNKEREQKMTDEINGDENFISKRDKHLRALHYLEKEIKERGKDHPSLIHLNELIKEHKILVAFYQDAIDKS